MLPLRDMPAAAILFAGGENIRKGAGGACDEAHGEVLADPPNGRAKNGPPPLHDRQPYRVKIAA
jgi:hypothetical protein